MKIDQVLEEYRQGDADKRMSLFLYHRGLREEFISIEQDDPGDLFAGAGTSEPAKESMVRKFLVMLRTGSWPLWSPASGGRAAP
jgi:hypothetical protein